MLTSLAFECGYCDAGRYHCALADDALHYDKFTNVVVSDIAYAHLVGQI